MRCTPGLLQGCCSAGCCPAARQRPHHPHASSSPSLHGVRGSVAAAGAGNGLFAERAFAKNELITEYYGEIISYEDAAARRDAGQHTHIRWGPRRFAHACCTIPPGVTPPCANQDARLAVARRRALNMRFRYIDGLKVPEPGRGGGSFANDIRESARTNAAYSTK